jgi:hypothetical protein
MGAETIALEITTSGWLELLEIVLPTIENKDIQTVINIALTKKEILKVLIEI